jgi:hypothetical protein
MFSVRKRSRSDHRRPPRREILQVEFLESRDVPSTGFTLGPLVQVSGPSPFAGSTVDNPASQPGFYVPGNDRDSIFFRDPPSADVETAAVASPLLGHASPVDSHSRPFKGVATGTVTGVDPSGAIVIAATGNATHLGDFTRTEYIFFGPGGTISGTVVFTAANGDQLWADFSGGFTSPTTLAGTYTFTGGTGRFKSATGTASFDATTLDGIHVAVSFDGSISY